MLRIRLPEEIGLKVQRNVRHAHHNVRRLDSLDSSVNVFFRALVEVDVETARLRLEKLDGADTAIELGLRREALQDDALPDHLIQRGEWFAAVSEERRADRHRRRRERRRVGLQQLISERLSARFQRSLARGFLRRLLRLERRSGSGTGTFALLLLRLGAHLRKDALG